jgi:hypothetical protein
MAALTFKPAPLVRVTDIEPFDTRKFRQFEHNRFGIYATECNDDGETIKTVERNPHSGKTYSPNRLDTSLSLSEAAAQIDNMRGMGDQRELGLILYMPENLVCVDFDGTDSADTDPAVQNAHMGILKSSATWIEKSVSGVGYHAFYTVNDAERQLLTNTNNADRQIDTRVVNGFVFLTGNVMRSAEMAPFSTIEPNFRDYLYQRCALAREASEGSSAKWHETAEHNDMDVMKSMFKRYPTSAEFLWTRQDQTGRSEDHFRAVCDLIRCSLNYEQVKRMYLSSESAEYAYRSENKSGVNLRSYEKWLTRNINGAAQELESSGRFFNPDDIFIDFDEAESAELEPTWTSDVTDYTPTEWIVQDVIPAEGVMSIFGPSGSGKTFITLDMLSAISCGRDWFGKRTKAVPVTYVGLEGQAGLRNRVYAYRKAHGDVGKMLMITEPLIITKAEDQQKLLRAMTKNNQLGGILVIDTMSKSNPGMDENKSDEMSSYIKAIEDLARVTYGVVLLVHHSGKDSDKGPRGHSSFIAALDSAIEVNRVPDSTARVLRTKKVKDGADDLEFQFELEAIEIGRDQWGFPAHSCVVRPLDKPDLTGLLANETVSDEDVFTLCGFMNSVPEGVEFREKGRYSPHSLLNEMQGWPAGWNKQRTDLVVKRGIDNGYLEVQDYTDTNGATVQCLVTAC